MAIFNETYLLFNDINHSFINISESAITEINYDIVLTEGNIKETIKSIIAKIFKWLDEQKKKLINAVDKFLDIILRRKKKQKSSTMKIQYYSDDVTNKEYSKEDKKAIVDEIKNSRTSMITAEDIYKYAIVHNITEISSPTIYEPFKKFKFDEDNIISNYSAESLSEKDYEVDYHDRSKLYHLLNMIDCAASLSIIPTEKGSEKYYSIGFRGNTDDILKKDNIEKFFKFRKEKIEKELKDVIDNDENRPPMLRKDPDELKRLLEDIPKIEAIAINCYYANFRVITAMVPKVELIYNELVKE